MKTYKIMEKKKIKISDSKIVKDIKKNKINLKQN